MCKKYKIKFWQDNDGYSETQDYIWELKKKAEKSKDARIKLKKITEYMEMLETYGTIIGLPYVDHIENCGVELYELRPIDDRFFFFCKQNNIYVILNYYKKKSQKTPKKEIEKAIRLMNDYIERNL